MSDEGAALASGMRGSGASRKRDTYGGAIPGVQGEDSPYSSGGKYKISRADPFPANRVTLGSSGGRVRLIRRA